MSKPLQGVKVIEVAMWAFVPTAGAILADMGAEVIKVEPPNGDPIRGLRIGLGAASAIDFSWESYNRGKRSITLDLKQQSGLDVLHRLLEDADVLLTSMLPPARRSLRIDAETLRARFPKLIYATGSAVGQKGADCDKGGFDAISFWARGGVSSAASDNDGSTPAGPPGPAFGDSIGGSMLAGGVCAALAKRAMTGEASIVDVSLLGAAMWSMQRAIAQAIDQGVARLPRPEKDKPNNVLSNTYRTRDDRFVALCMLQSDRYWPGFCEVAGCPDLAGDPRFADARARKDNLDACVAELKALFAAKTLAEWREILARQSGQWDVVQHVGELGADPQALANGYLQSVMATAGREISLVSAPMQFDGEALATGPAPDIGAHSDAVLAALGYTEEQVIDLKVAGVVF